MPASTVSVAGRLLGWVFPETLRRTWPWMACLPSGRRPAGESKSQQAAEAAIHAAHGAGERRKS